MNRHSSNRVKMLKIEASARKHTTKLNTSERSNVASIRFGKPNADKPRCVVCRVFVTVLVSFDLLGQIEIEERSGILFTNRKKRLRTKMKTVANHGPTYGETVP